MTAELNELFEQGITHCGELADAVDAAMTAIDDTAEQAKETAERVEQEGAEARQHLRGLVDRLAKAGEAIGAAREEAEGALEALSGKALELRTEVGDLLERVRKAIAQVDAHRSRIDDSLDAQMAEAQDDFSDLAGKTQELEAEASRRIEQASEAIERFRTALDAARNEFGRKKAAWDAALEELETHARERAVSCVAGLQGLLQRQTAAMVGAANVMVDRHNDAMNVIKQEFAEQAPQELSAALEPVQAALRALAEEAAAREQALTSRVEELRGAIGRHAPVLAELKAAFHATAELG